jgi:hypothetical protein
MPLSVKFHHWSACGERKNHRQKEEIAKTNGIANVNILKITDRKKKSQKRTESQM